jgi:Neurochondrin
LKVSRLRLGNLGKSSEAVVVASSLVLSSFLVAVEDFISPPKLKRMTSKMEETLQSASSSSTALTDPIETFDKLQQLLKTKNDTSRFVGLALLKAVLDNGQLAQDTDRIHLIWESLSPKFFDRLLHARENDRTTKSEVKDMIDLSVSILHTLANLLPASDLRQKRMTSRLGPLVNSLLQRLVLISSQSCQTPC